MAILPRYPGFEVTVEVNGIPLPEHAPVKIVEANAMPTDDAESAPTATPLAATSIVKYVESPLSSEFTIRYKCTPGFGYASDHIYLEPSLDGKAILVPDLRYSPEHGCDSQVCYGGASWQGDAMRTQRFRFAELDIGSLRHCPRRATLILCVVEDQTTDEMRRVLLDQGEIKLDFFFTNEGQTVTATDLPPLVFDNIEKPVSAKAVKETLARTGCMPVQSAGLAPAVDRMGGHLEEVKTVGKLGTFIFKYRTTSEPTTAIEDTDPR
ncbi:hypothetical protein SLS60_000751 [Paraconiothyrium brasiliense]|uniref:DUF7918 domain-containing protein n=1 Tax=Paraconiothyrium brasiliense TaxID=300254 RepID=A0ABR3S891_9PLEO